MMSFVGCRRRTPPPPPAEMFTPPTPPLKCGRRAAAVNRQGLERRH